MNFFAIIAFSFWFYTFTKALPSPAGGGDNSPTRASSPNHIYLSSPSSVARSSPSHSSSPNHVYLSSPSSVAHSSSSHSSAQSSPKAKEALPPTTPNVDSPKQYTSRTAGYYLADAGHSLAMAGTTLLGNPIAGCAGAIKCATKAGMMKTHVIGHNLTPEQRSKGVEQELEQAKKVAKSGVKYAAAHTIGFAAQTGTRVISSGAQVRKTASRHGAADEAYPNHKDYDSFTHKAHQKKKELSEDRKETRRQTFHGMTDMMKGKEPVYDPRH